MATREAIRADAEIACLMLGADPQVAELLSGLQITDIDRIAEHQFRHIEPGGSNLRRSGGLCCCQ
jgi:hypothetical protein